MNNVQILKLTSAIVALNIIMALAQPPSLQAQSLKIQVDAGAFDRLNTVVDFRLPVSLEPGVYTLISQDGNHIPLQVDHSGSGWFILKSLESGKSATFELHKSSSNGETNSGNTQPQPNNAVSFQKDEATIQFFTHKGPVLSYFHGFNSPPAALDDRYKRGGYIHPVFSPSGLELTNHLNANAHPHHAGIWSAWTNTIYEGNKPDFWNLHRSSGRVDIDTLLHFWEGPVMGGFASKHSFFDLTGDEPQIALNELWEVRVYNVESDANNAYYLFDLLVTQTTNTGRPLILPEYRYGGIGFRGHEDWDDPFMSDFLTSEGLGRDGNAERARWVHMGGYVGDNLAGLAILGHPTNYRFPQPARIHPSEPFFNFAPTQMGEMSIQPGLPYETRFRIVTSDGEPDAALIDRLWNDYAYPPGVSVVVK